MSKPQPQPQPQPQPPRNPQLPAGIDDHTPGRVIHEYDIPIGIEDWQIPEGDCRTSDFGVIKTVCLKLLSPLEEKRGVGRSKGDALQMAYELSKISLDGVIDANGQMHLVRDHDGSLEMLYAQMHPKIRSLVMQAYSDCAAPTTKASNSFLKSRRTRI